MSEALHGLPPLNPMSTAPKNGAVILIMIVNGVIFTAWWNDDMLSWQARSPGQAIEPDRDDIIDDNCLGWWPLPEVAE